MAERGRKPNSLDPNHIAAAVLPVVVGEPVGQDAERADGMADPRSKALEIRATWMRKMGFSEEEIAAACIDDGSPVDLADELEQLKYADKLKEITPPASVLSSLAVKR